MTEKIEHQWELNTSVADRKFMTEKERFLYKDIYCKVRGISPDTLSEAGECVQEDK